VSGALQGPISSKGREVSWSPMQRMPVCMLRVDVRQLICATLLDEKLLLQYLNDF
jgi:hypothetical protein